MGALGHLETEVLLTSLRQLRGQARRVCVRLKSHNSPCEKHAVSLVTAITSHTFFFLYQIVTFSILHSLHAYILFYRKLETHKSLKIID